MKQYHYDKKVVSQKFPVFIKPEWAQNSEGIVRVDTENFHIVEIDLFLPMTLVLLAENIDHDQKRYLVREMMTIATQLVKTAPFEQTGKSFFSKR